MSTLIYSYFEMRSVIMLPTPVFWPSKFHGLYGPWVHRVRHNWATFTFSLSKNKKHLQRSKGFWWNTSLLWAPPCSQIILFLILNGNTKGEKVILYIQPALKSKFTSLQCALRRTATKLNFIEGHLGCQKFRNRILWGPKKIFSGYNLMLFDS